MEARGISPDDEGSDLEDRVEVDQMHENFNRQVVYNLRNHRLSRSDLLPMKYGQHNTVFFNLPPRDTFNLLGASEIEEAMVKKAWIRCREAEIFLRVALRKKQKAELSLILLMEERQRQGILE
jgi:hypothetical protein